MAKFHAHYAGRKVLDVKYVYAHPGGLTGRWIGIDITHLAISLVEKRLKDAFPGIAFTVEGTPKDLASAQRALTQANTDKDSLTRQLQSANSASAASSAKAASSTQALAKSEADAKARADQLAKDLASAQAKNEAAARDLAAAQRALTQANTAADSAARVRSLHWSRGSSGGGVNWCGPLAEAAGLTRTTCSTPRATTARNSVATVSGRSHRRCVSPGQALDTPNETACGATNPAGDSAAATTSATAPGPTCAPSASSSASSDATRSRPASTSCATAHQAQKPSI